MGIKIDAHKAYRMEFLVREEFDKGVYDMLVKNDPVEVWAWFEENLVPKVPYKHVRYASWKAVPVYDELTDKGCLSVEVNFKVGKTKIETC